jgi:hypothetical protein
MRMNGWIALALALCIAAVLTADGQALAEEALTVTRYCDLTIERLRLVHLRWDRDGRPLRQEEEAALWQLFRTTPEAYFAFASENASELERYLASRPDLQSEIERLGSLIRTAIETKDARR